MNRYDSRIRARHQRGIHSHRPRKSCPLCTPPGESEADFQTWLKDTALVAGWLYYHTYDSRHSDEGFPDVVLVKDRLIFAELKGEGKEATPAQTIWLNSLRRAGIEAYLWRPGDRPSIEQILGLRRA